MSEEVRVDTVVVGAGNAALCAAIAAANEGADVLVLERAPEEKKGGNSFFTDGAIRFAFNNGLVDLRMVKQDMSEEEAARIQVEPYTEEDYWQDFARMTKGKCDEKLVRNLISNSFDTILWLKENGVAFEMNYDNQSFEQNGTYHFFGGNPMKVVDKGIGLMAFLNKRLEALSVPVWYNSRATKLIRTNGRVTGVQVEKDGRTIQVNAQSVVLACGSFEGSKEMREKHMGSQWAGAIVRGTQYNTGDGLSMALDAGAVKHGDWGDCHSISTDYNAPKVGDFEKPGDIFKKHSYPYGLMINTEGKRFVDEGADIRNYTYAKYGKEVLKQPGNKAYQVFDHQVRHLLRKEYELDEATKYKADTLEELVEKLDVDRDGFLETVKAYNEAVQDGNFDPSKKDGKHTEGITPPKSNWALELKEGPFYAFPVTCGITFNFGGILVSEEGEVLDEKRKPVEGLYAAGEMVGGLFYHNYPGASGLMSGAVYGRLAGKAAAAFAKGGSAQV